MSENEHPAPVVVSAIHFADGSVFPIPKGWLGPLQEKHAEQHHDKTWTEFLAYIRDNIEAYFDQKVVNTKFGLRPWDRPDQYPTMAALCEDSLYAFARFYIMRAIGKTMGVKVMTPEELLAETDEKETH